jgi:hypothetical protein
MLSATIEYDGDRPRPKHWAVVDFVKSEGGTMKDLSHKMRSVGQRAAFSVAVGACTSLALYALSADADVSGRLAIEAVSTHKNYVSGGDVLVRVKLPSGVSTGDATISVQGRDVTASFRDMGDGTMLGLVTGLPEGKATIHVRAQGAIPAMIDVTNYPITGPIISGPHDTTFICQTHQFFPTTTTNLVTQTPIPGSTALGPALDANCSIAPRVDYVYRTTSENWLLLPSNNSVPSDAARTVTSTGLEVPFIVRIDTRTVNRGIYQSAVLFDPTMDTMPSPFIPPRAWNRRLVAFHGYGCTGGWYIQGNQLGNLSNAGTEQQLLDHKRLGLGYATFSNTLQHPSASCNGLLGAETAMMSKESFIEQYGPPAWTFSHGSSGGSYTSSRYTDIVPGLFDGIIISATFPEPNAIALNGLDGRLITNYRSRFPGALNDPEVVAVTGFKGVTAMVDLARQSGRTDPVPGRVDLPGYASAVFNPAVPVQLRYHPASNPAGLRGTVFDWESKITTVDPRTGFARRPFDNVGVQYGLRALNSGAIGKEQFLHLNENIGGYDQDANYISERSVGDPTAIRRYYQSGVHMSGGGGLAAIPVMNVGGSNEDAGYHYSVFHFAARERLREANGHADNFVMWRGLPPYDEAFETMAAWIDAYKSDHGAGSQLDKVLRNSPPDAVDTCFDAAGNAIQEPQTLSPTPNSQCNALFPTWELTRIIAGGPVSLGIMKCQLKAVDQADYNVTFTPAELARLRRIFPAGVCDWSKPGAHQVEIVPLSSAGPASQNRLSRGR